MQILLIEDNPDHADLMMDCIQEAFAGRARINWLQELEPALEIINCANKDQLPDICFCDLQLPDSSTFDTINTLNSLESPLPIIVMTSLHDEEKARQLIQGGVQDYIAKDDLEARHLYKTCIYAIERQRQTVLLEEKNRDQASFCYSLSHDFKGPIRRIGITLDFLKEDLSKRIELQAEEIEHFDMIKKNIGVMNMLISDLYQYLSLDANTNNFDHVDLNAVIEESKQLLDVNTEDLTLNINTLPTVEGNRSQLVLLFKNLLDNSVKYCRYNPIIIVRYDTSPSERYAVITIKDNGIGIDADKIGNIFTPFQRLHNEQDIPGSGLGLSIVKRIVDNHNGSIYADSKTNDGTTISVHLPFKQLLSLKPPQAISST